jgi:integrase
VVESGSPVRGLTLLQINDPQRLRRFLQEVADTRGTQAAKMLRSVLSRVLGYAVDNGVLTTNALRQVARVSSQFVTEDDGRDRSRAFNRQELDAVLAYADGLAKAPTLNPRTQRKWETAADLAAFMAGTGVRIAEARATRWDHLDLETGRYDVPGTKSANSRRTLNMPSWLIQRMLKRSERTGVSGLAFSSPAHLDEPERPWDQSNSSAAMRAVLDGAGMDWAVPHTFRKTVATRLHEGGVPTVRISDQLGHADPAFTLRTYIGRELEGDKSDLAALL